MSARDVQLLERHGWKDSPVHRLDPRAKVVATFIFIVTVASFPKDVLSPLFPFLLYPLLLSLLGYFPLRELVRRTLWALPLVALIGIFNPLLDRSPGLSIAGFTLSRGWISFFSLLLRGLLCISAAVVLTGITAFPLIIQALQELKIPRALTVQLMLLYRYLFLLLQQAQRLRRAKTLRSTTRRTSIPTASAMLSVLMLRTIDQADILWMAMKARGFEGELRVVPRLLWRPADSLFLATTAALCLFFRLVPVPELIGRLGVGT